jgi:hypothetical protein
MDSAKMEASLLTLKLGIAVAIAMALCWFLIVKARRSRSAAHSAPGSVDLAAMRQDLLTGGIDPELYKTELEPLFTKWEARYGNQIPLDEVNQLQNFAQAKIADLESRKAEIINRGAEEGATIEVAELRRRLNDSKEAYAGPDKAPYEKEIDALLESLPARYGSSIPVDQAYDLMKKLENETRRD